MNNRSPNSSKITIAIILILLLLVSAFFVYPKIFNKSSNNKASSNKNQGKIIKNVPNLELTVVEYPKQINTFCDVVEIKVKVKNVGGATLSYQDLLNKKYQFALTQGNTAWPVWMKIGVDEMGRQFNSTIDDFGDIKVGEEKVIVIRSGHKGVIKYGEGVEDTAILRNMFSQDMDARGENGDFTYFIEFNQIKDESHHPRLSISDKFTVHSAIFNGPHDLKDCSWL